MSRYFLKYPEIVVGTANVVGTKEVGWALLSLVNPTQNKTAAGHFESDNTHEVKNCGSVRVSSTLIRSNNVMIIPD